MHSMKASNTKFKALIFLTVALSGAFAIYWFQKPLPEEAHVQTSDKIKTHYEHGCLRSLFTNRVTLAFVCIAKP